MKNDSTEPLVQEIRENRIAASGEWDDVIDEAKKDRLCIAGKPWDAIDPKGKKQRMDAKRPVIALDELGQYLNQTVNDVRANPRSIKYAPTGNGANDKGAEFYQNHTREIEYRSHATVAYSTAFDNCVSSSVGWLRVNAKREHIRTFNQDLWIEPVVNPDQVLPDPNFVWPDARDMKFLYYIEPWMKSDFKRKFKNAKVTDFSGGQRALASLWLQKDMVQVAEYWKLVSIMRKLVAFQRAGKQPNGQPYPIETMLRDEMPGGKLPGGATLKREEEVEDTEVKCYLTNGLEILKENTWKGKYIPFVSCLGKILYVDEGQGSHRQIMSMTRLARDPYMLYCYYCACEMELIGMTPKFPYFAYEGQLSPSELTNLQKSLHEPVAVIRVKPFIEGTPGNQPLGFPARQPYEPPIQGIEVGKEAARRAIQAAMGISPLPTQAQRHNEKSGVALKQIESSGDRGSFHFKDHYKLMLERTGVILEDLMDKTLDTARSVPVRDAQDSASSQRINDPSDPESVDTRGDYRVTVSEGPASENQRQDGSDFVDSMTSNLPTIAQLAGPQRALALLAKSVKLKRLGPIGDEIVKLLEPPAQNGPNGKPLPPEVQAMVQQLQSQLQQVQQEMQKAGQIIQTDQVKANSAKELKMLDIQFQREKLDRDNETKLAVAELGAKVDRLALFLEEREQLGLQRQALADRLHESTEFAKDRIHDVVTSAQDHGEAIDQGAAGVQGQVAAAQPEQAPADGAAA